MFVAKTVKGIIGDGKDVKNPAMAAAKLAAALDPNIEVVSTDESNGTITLRDKKDGKTITVNFEDLKKGKIIFEDEKGEVVQLRTQSEGGGGSLEIETPEGKARFGAGDAKLPAWLPAYPGTSPKSSFSMRGDKKDAAMVQLTTKDSVDQVAAFYEDALKKAGFKVTRTTLGSDGKSIINLTGSDDAKARTANVTVTPTGNSETMVNLMYEAK
ncbi:MAG: hypothetical protein ACKV22_10035 [Bryobacteraceae bacterium]